MEKSGLNSLSMEIKGKRIALRKLPTDFVVNHVFFWGYNLSSDIHQLVEINGISYGRFGTGKVGDNYTVQLDNNAFGKGANPNYVHQCPLGTTKTTKNQIPKGEYGWVFYSNGNGLDMHLGTYQVNYCT